MLCHHLHQFIGPPRFWSGAKRLQPEKCSSSVQTLSTDSNVSAPQNPNMSNLASTVLLMKEHVFFKGTATTEKEENKNMFTTIPLFAQSMTLEALTTG